METIFDTPYQTNYRVIPYLTVLVDKWMPTERGIYPVAVYSHKTGKGLRKLERSVSADNGDKFKKGDIFTDDGTYIVPTEDKSQWRYSLNISGYLRSMSKDELLNAADLIRKVVEENER